MTIKFGMTMERLRMPPLNKPLTKCTRNVYFTHNNIFSSYPAPTDTVT